MMMMLHSVLKWLPAGCAWGLCWDVCGHRTQAGQNAAAAAHYSQHWRHYVTVSVTAALSAGGTTRRPPTDNVSRSLAVSSWSGKAFKRRGTGAGAIATRPIPPKFWAVRKSSCRKIGVENAHFEENFVAKSNFWVRIISSIGNLQMSENSVSENCNFLRRLLFITDDDAAANVVSMVWWGNDSKGLKAACLIHSLRVEKRWSFQIIILKMFSNERVLAVNN